MVLGALAFAWAARSFRRREAFVRKATRLGGLVSGLWVLSKRPGAKRLRRGDVAVVTGGSRGLGLLLAHGLARRGLSVALVARDSRELAAAKRRLERETGARVQTVTQDLEERNAATRVVNAVISRFGRLDVLVNDAGVISVGPQKAMSLDDYRHSMETNFFAALQMTQAALPHLEESRGSILNVTSVGGAVPVPHLLPYTASKFAFAGWSAGLAAELANNGVRVVTVLPWLMRTGSFLHAEVKGRREKEARNFTLAASLPLLTLSADRAAARMLRALDRGERFVTVGIAGKVARLGFALLPNVALVVLSVANRFLPGMTNGAAGAREKAEPVWRHREGLASSFLTVLGDRAARRNNEVLTLVDQR